MAHFHKPPPDAWRILRDLHELFAYESRTRITVTIDGPGPSETSTTVIDRRGESLREMEKRHE